MYRISVEAHFDAAHFLRGYQGKCEAVHGHRYRVVVRIEASGVNDIGLAYDFTELKAKLKAIIKRFDHILLNDMPPFDKINPSAENVARTIYGEIKPELKEAPVTLSSVSVWESPDSGVEYSEG